MRKLLLMSVLMVCAILTYAQPIVSFPAWDVASTSSSINVCEGDEVLRVGIDAKMARTNGIVILNLPPGVLYVSGSVTATGGSMTIAENSIVDLNAPEFSLNGGGAIAVGDDITFTIAREAGCGAVDHDLGGGLFKDSISVISTSGASTFRANEYDPSIQPYNVEYAAIAVLPVPTILTSLGTTECRNVPVRQGGTGCTSSYTHSVVVGSCLSDYELKYGGAVIPPTSTSGDTLFYDIDFTAAPFLAVGNGDGCFDDGEEIIFEECFKTKCCTNVSTKHGASWGCAGEECLYSAPQTGNVNFTNGIPVLKLTKTGDSGPELCGPVVFKTKIENTGNETTPAGGAVALDVTVFMGMGSNGSALSTLGNVTLWGTEYADKHCLSNFQIINGGVSYPFDPDSIVTDLGGVYAGTNIDYLPPNYFTADPDGPGGLEDIDGDGFFDDLASGNSIEIAFDFEIKPEVTCGQGRGDLMRWEHMYFDVSYSNQCLGARPPVRVDHNYRNFIRDYQIPTITTGPTDLIDGQCFSVAIKPYLFMSGGMTCQGQNGLTSDSAEWKVIIDLVPGITADPAGSFDPALFPVADFATTYEVFPDRIEYTINQYDHEWFSFDLKFDCAAWLAGGGTSPMYLPFRTKYICKDGGDACYEQDIHCKPIDLVPHCGLNCVGPATIDYLAERTTPGWTDNTMTTLVDLDNTPTTVRDYYYPYDTMLICSRAIIVDTALSDLRFDITYTLGCDGATVVKPELGELTIFDVSSASTTTVQIGAADISAPTSLGGGSYMVTVDVSGYNTNAGATYLYGGDSGTPGVYDRDTITVCLNMVWTCDIPEETYCEVTGFRGSHYSLTPLGDTLECDSWGDRAYYEHVEIRTGGYTRSIKGCEVGELRHYLTHGAASGDNHPDEYRPIASIDSFVIDMPENLTECGAPVWSIGSVPMVKTYNSDSSKMILKMPAGHAYDDKKSTHYPHVKTYWCGTCETPSVNNVPHTAYWTEEIYHPDQSVHKSKSDSDNGRVNYTSPSFNISPASANIDAVSEISTWDVDVCNTTSNQDVGYNGVFIDPNPVVPIIGACEIIGGVETPLTIENRPEGLWIPFGALNRTECRTIRIKAKFTECMTNCFDFEHVWACDAFPADLGALGSSCFDARTLCIEPKPSQVQLNITAEPGPFDLCTPISYELEINSAQIADLVNPWFNVDAGASGAMITSIDVEYPSGSGDVQNMLPTITGTVHAFDLRDHTEIDTIGGIQGTQTAITANDRKAKITVNVATDCSFKSGEVLKFIAGGEWPCGDPAFGNGVTRLSEPLEFTEAAALYDAITTVSASDTSFTCGAPITLSVETLIQGANAPAGDTTTVSFPVGMMPVMSSYLCTSADCPTVVTDFTNNMIYFINPAVLDGNNVSFDLDFMATNSDGCEDAGEILVQTKTRIPGVMCGAMTCPDMEAVLGAGEEAVTIDKPDVTFANMNVTEDGNSPGLYYAAGDIINNGNGGLAVGDSLEMDVYCADATGNATGAAITTFMVYGPLAANSTTPFNFSFGASACDPTMGIVFAVDSVANSTNANCVCTSEDVHVGNIVLPIELAAFDASLKDCAAEISWTTLLEEDLKTFVVEFSTDGLNFEVFQYVTPTGGTFKQTYKVVDETIEQDRYYRLRSLDNDGKFAYSPIAFVDYTGCKSVKIQPNPVMGDEIMIITTGLVDYSNVSIQLMDVSGKIMKEVKLTEDQLQLNVKELPAGAYFIRVRLDDVVHSHEKFIKL